MPLRMARTPLGAALGLVVLGFAIGLPTQAVDGALEINQTCAVNTGCFAGDTAGWPVQITSSGSYVLTGNLNAPDHNTTVISVLDGGVTIDLNGFAILGPQVAGNGDGISCSNVAVTIRNGIVGFVGRHGIACELVRVENVTVVGCGADGIIGSGIVSRSLLSANGGFGLNGDFAADASFFSLNNSGSFNESGVLVAEGVGNSCDDGACSPDGRRRFYLTQTFVNGASALTACDGGFHMASLWEIFEVSKLRYDRTRGVVSLDSGDGPPIFTLAGWVRTGDSAANNSNCVAWTSMSNSNQGAAVRLTREPNWSDAATATSPWIRDSYSCNSSVRVWCVQD